MLKDKTAIVTGSTSGIGLGVAERLASLGCRIVLNGFGDDVDALVRRLQETYQVDVRHSPADMSVPAQIREMAALADEAFGGADILVNNAGIQHVAPIEEFPAEKWEKILAINLSAAFYATQAVLPGMKQKGFGRILNIASAHGVVGSPFKSAYVAAKHGLVGLTKVTALETAESGVTCNAICPGYVKTPLVEKQIADQAKAHNIPEQDVVRNILLAKQPNKRFVTVEELAGLAAFLCGPDAQSVTGAVWAMDGGWTAE